MHPSDESTAALALVHQGWGYLRTQRPLAAWASWRRALRVKPEDPAATQALEILDAATDLPGVLRTAHRYKPPRGEERTKRWRDLLENNEADDLARAAALFNELHAGDREDHEALYNQGLSLAWSGDNALAHERLAEFAALVAANNSEAAVESFVLAEFLAQGAATGLEAATDWNYALTLVPRSGTRDLVTRLKAIATWIPCRLATDADEEVARALTTRAYELLDRPMPPPASDLSVDELPRILGSVIATPTKLRFSSTDRWRLKRIEWMLAPILEGRKFSIERTSSPLPIRLMDADAWTFRLPSDVDDETRNRLTRDAVERYYEDHWIHRPRRGLLSERDELVSTPLAASRFARSSSARALEASARLEAAIRTREQLGARPKTAILYGGYPFDRLRNRMGLDAWHRGAVDPTDLSCMSEQQLDEVDSSKWDLPMLREGFRSAYALARGSRPTSARLARELVQRDPSALAGNQSGAILNVLMRQALHERAPARALAWLDRSREIGGDAPTNNASFSLQEAWRAALLAVDAENGPGSLPDVTAELTNSITLAAAERLLDLGQTDLALSMILDVQVQATDPENLEHATQLLATDPLGRASDPTSADDSD
jgi:hypothetical protein